MEVISRSISMATDAVVLGVTLWNTFYIFGLDKEAKATVRVTATLTHNGNLTTLIDMAH